MLHVNEMYNGLLVRLNLMQLILIDHNNDFDQFGAYIDFIIRCYQTAIL